MEFIMPFFLDFLDLFDRHTVDFLLELLAIAVADQEGGDGHAGALAIVGHHQAVGVLRGFVIYYYHEESTKVLHVLRFGHEMASTSVHKDDRTMPCSPA